ncbi:hypothetical protein C9374_014252 [Naegleria lovaniensis]|uniref:Uncharacterized protein n=1 Tax=Naegleria lovaniensis TaxID=51637 RepID=A0AA88GB39_NAELO|nr:uncharacterized protein C9374_014252 [Naegleria lovaniensis]KAG2370758.1 hypothetical protein C9374_014252 [Naegleria lovaniensis]
MTLSRRIDKLLFELGYCSKIGLRRFLSNHELTLIKHLNNNKQIHEKFLGTKKQLRQVITPSQLLINGQPVHTLNPLIIAFDKPEGWTSESLGSLYDYTHFQYHQKMKKNFKLIEQQDVENPSSSSTIQILSQEEEEYSEEEVDDDEYTSDEHEISSSEQIYSILDLLPKEYPLRKPEFQSILPLPDEIGGLTIITQLHSVAKAFRSVRAPCRRVYRIQTRDGFTGLEDEALLHFRSDIKDSIKRVINPPEFFVVDEKKHIAEISLYDYKPDKIREMMKAIRHELLSVKRIGLGGILLDEDLPELVTPKLNDETGLVELTKQEMKANKKHWVALDEDRIEKLMSSKQEVVDRLKIEKSKGKVRREEELQRYARETNIRKEDFNISMNVKQEQEFKEEAKITETILGVDQEYPEKLVPKKNTSTREQHKPKYSLTTITEAAQAGNPLMDMELDEKDMEELQRWNEETTEEMRQYAAKLERKKAITSKKKK